MLNTITENVWNNRRRRRKKKTKSEPTAAQIQIRNAGIQTSGRQVFNWAQWGDAHNGKAFISPEGPIEIDLLQLLQVQFRYKLHMDQITIRITVALVGNLNMEMAADCSFALTFTLKLSLFGNNGWINASWPSGWKWILRSCTNFQWGEKKTKQKTSLSKFFTFKASGWQNGLYMDLSLHITTTLCCSFCLDWLDYIYAGEASCFSKG